MKSSIIRFAILVVLLVLGIQINAIGAERAFKAQVTGTLEPDLNSQFGVGHDAGLYAAVQICSCTVLPASHRKWDTAGTAPPRE